MQNFLTDLQQLKFLLKSHNLFAKKSLGQNFLINQEVLNKIVEASNIKKNDKIFEIGPGLGTLTFELAQKAKHVTTIEKDSKLIPILKQTIKDFKNVTIINEDVLKYCPSKNKYKIVANIPYYITSPLINHFIKNQFINSNQNPRVPTSLVLLTQKEVAEKICAKTPNLNVMAINIQTFAKPEIIEFVSKNNFFPSPKVNSAIIKITTSKKSKVDPNILKTYFKLIEAGFSQKRKKLHNSLTHGLHIKNDDIKNLLIKSGIDSNRRAESLSIKEWEKLTKRFIANSVMK